MTKNLLIFILAFLINIYEVVGGKLEQVGSNFLKPYATNKGEETYYQFQMLPENEILSNAKVQIQFPLEFSLYNFSEELECSISVNGEFQEKECEYYPGNIVEIEVGQLKISTTTIVIGTVTNPSNVGSSSNFRVTSLYNNVIIDQNQGFGMVSFSEPPGEINNPSVTIISNDRISEGSTYQFRFTSSRNHYGETTIRFTFPDGFNSQSAMCDIQNLIGDNPETRIYHNNRIVGCIKANKDILNTEEQIVKIVNMVNPNFSGYFQGFGIEIMDGDSSVVLEKISYPDFAAIVQVQPGQLVAEYEQSAKFKWAQVQYGFEINLINKLDENGRLYINFTQEWSIESETCQIISGFEQLPGKNVTCTLIENGVDAKAYRIENFKSIGPDTQLVVQMDLESPHELGTYDVQINTYNTIRESVIDIGNVNIMINDTYGINEVWRAHPIKSPITLKAGETGPLEIIFFLKTELLKTNVGTFGKFRIEIFPAIPYPPEDPTGVLKCYFYADIPSDDCTYTVIMQPEVETGDPVPYKTMIQMNTPLDYSFKESEIPLTVTTSGAVPGQPTGITLDKMVKRYMFHIHMLTGEGIENLNVTSTFKNQADGPSPHTEYYFTEFVPVPYVMNPDTDATLLKMMHYDNGEYSMLYLTVVQDFLDDFLDEHWAAKRNYKLRIRFSSQEFAWQNDLGQGNEIRYEYPCYVGGTITTDAHVLRCDLVTFTGANPESYVDIYGFQTDQIIRGNDLEIRIPKLQLSTNDDRPLTIDIMFIEETPGMRADVVVIGEMTKEVGDTIDNTFTTSTNVAITYPTSSIINDGTSIQFVFTGITAGTSNIIIALPTNDSDFPAMQFPYVPLNYEGDDIYHSQSGCVAGVADCEYFGQDVNWLVVTARDGQSLSGSVTVLTDASVSGAGGYNEFAFFQPPYEATWNYAAWAIKDNIIDQAFTKVVQTDAEVLTVASFGFEAPAPNPIRAITEYIFEVSFTIQNPVRGGGSITLDFDGLNIQNTEHWYCKIEGDIQQLTGRGIMCEEDDVNGREQVIITNFAQLDVGDVVTVFLALETQTADGTPNVSITTYWEANKTRRVDYKDNLDLDQAITLDLTILDEFKVMEPAIVDEKPQAGYIGPVYIKIDMNNASTIGNDQNLYIGLEKFTKPQGRNWPLLCYVLEGCAGNTKEQIDCGYYDFQNYDNMLQGDRLIITIASNDVQSCFEGAGVGVKTLMITTEEASPDHGLIYPQYGGIYEISIEISSYRQPNALLNEPPNLMVKNIVEQQTQYLELQPPKLRYLDVEFITQLTGELNYFTLFGQLSVDLPKYADDADPDNPDRYFIGGRILMEFPTQDHNGNTLFAQDLGVAGRVTGQSMGCWFKGIDPLTDREIDCRFIKAESAGDIAYVEVINFDAMSAGDEFEIMVGPIANPAADTTNLEIGLLTYAHDGTITPGTYQAEAYSMARILLNYSKVYKFIDSQASANKAVIDDTTNHFAFEAGTKVQQYKRDLLYKMVYDEAMAVGDYFVVQIPYIFTLKQITTADDANLNNPSCDTTAYDYCRNLHNINQIIYKLKTAYTTGLRDGDLQIQLMPVQFPQNDITVTTYLYKAATNQVGTVTNKIRENPTLQGGNTVFDTPTITYLTQIKEALVDQDYVEVEVSFTINSSIPKTGTIEIILPASLAEVYPNCKSMVNRGSTLYSSAHYDEGKLGHIECNVQGNSWVITGFNALGVTIDTDTNAVSDKKLVVIQGKVKNPTSAQTNLVGRIRVYSDQHATNVFTNGSLIIDEDNIAVDTGVNAGDIVAQDLIKVDSELMFLETKYLKAGQTGPVKFSVTFAADQSGAVVVSLSKTEKDAGGTSGFQNLSAAQQGFLVGYFIDITAENERKIGAEVVYTNDASNQIFSITPDDTLVAGQEYHIVLDTINKATADTFGGLTYPTALGLYRAQISANGEQQSFYIETLPGEFTTINLKCLNYLKNDYNYLDLEITPTTQIGQNDLLVIEIATADANGNALFDQSQLEVNNDNTFKYDVIDNHLTLAAGDTITSADCRMFKGDSSAGVAEPLRIVCSSFSDNIADDMSFRAIFEIKNGDVSVDTYIPVSVYSRNQADQRKTNYNFFDRIYYIKNEAAGAATTFDPAWDNSDDEMGATSNLTFDAPIAFRAQSRWIMKYAVSLPKTTKLAAINTNDELIYCTNMEVIIIEVTNAEFDGTGGVTMANHVNQDFFLEAAQLAITYYYSDFYKRETVLYDHGVNTPPNTTPPTASNPITAASVTLKDDYTKQGGLNDLRVTITTTGYAKINKFVVDLEFDEISFRTNADCSQAIDSEVTVARCYITQGSGAGTTHYMNIYIQQQSTAYTGELDLIVETRNLAFINPAADITHTFVARAFSWNSDTEPTLDLTNDDYVTQKFEDNTATITGFSATTATASFDKFELIHERYIEEYYFINDEAYTPIQFEITTAAGTEAGAANVEIILPPQLSIEAEQAISDVLVNKLLCYIDDVITDCTMTGSTVSIDFTATAGAQTLVFKITVIDQRVYPKKEGFKWTDNDDSFSEIAVKATVSVGSTPTEYVHITELIPVFMQGGSTKTDDISAAVINSFTSALNYITINVAANQFQSNKMAYIVVEFEHTGYTASGGEFSMHGLEGGDRFPCSAQENLEVNSDLVCVFVKGTATRKMAVIVGGFKITAVNADSKFNLVIENPGVDATVLQATVSVYQTSTAGNRRGELDWSGKKLFNREKIDILTTVASPGNADETVTDFIAPVQYPVGQDSQWTLTNVSGGQVDQDAVILIQLPISDSAGKVCNFDNLDTNIKKNYFDLSGELYVYLAYTAAADIADDGTFTIGQVDHSEGFSCASVAGTWEMKYISLDNKATFVTSTIITALAPAGPTPPTSPAALTAIDLTGSEQKLHGGRFQGAVTRQKMSFDLTSIGAVGITYVGGDHILTLTFTGTVMNSDTNQCLVVGGASNNYFAPVVCEFVSATEIKISNFNILGNTLLIELKTTMQEPTTGDVQIQVSTISNSSYIDADLTLQNYFWEVVSDLGTPGTVDSTTSDTEFVFTLSAIDQDLDTTTIHKTYIDLVFINQSDYSAAYSSVLNLGGTDLVEVTDMTAAIGDYIWIPGDGGDNGTYKKIRYTITDHQTNNGGAGPWAMGTTATLTFTHGIDATNLQTLYEESYAYFMVIVSEELGANPGVEVVRSTTHYYIDQILNDSAIAGGVSYLYQESGVANQVELTFTPLFSNFVLEFDSTFFEQHLIVHTTTLDDSFQFPCLQGTTQITCIRIKNLAEPVVYFTTAFTPGTSYTLKIPGVEIKDVAAQTPVIKIRYQWDQFSVFNDGTDIQITGFKDETFGDQAMAGSATIGNTAQFFTSDDTYTNTSGAMADFKIEMRSIPSTNDPKFMLSIYSADDEVDFSNSLYKFCGTYTCDKISHNGLTFMIGDVSGNGVTQLDFEDATDDLIPVSPDTFNYSGHSFEVSVVVADSTGSVVEREDGSVSISVDVTIPDPTSISRVGPYSSLHTGQTAYLMIKQEITYTEGTVEVHFELGNVSGTISTCSAFQMDTNESAVHQDIKCIYDNGTGSDLLIVKMYDQSRTTGFSSGNSNQIHVIVLVENSTTDATQLTVTTSIYQSYTSNVSNVLIGTSGSISDNVVFDYVNAAGPLTATVNQYKPKLFGEDDNPIRINFKLGADLTVYQMFFDGGDAAYDIADNAVCYLRTIVDSTGSIASEELVDCSYTSTAWTLTYDGTSGKDLVAANSYELVLATDNFASYGIPNTGVMEYLFSVHEHTAADTGALEIEKEGVLYQYQDAAGDEIGFGLVYFTTTRPTEVQNFHLQFTTPVVKPVDKPNDKIYVEFEGLALSDFTGYSNGDVIPCQLSSNLAQRKSLDAWCKALQNDDNGNFQVNIIALSTIPNNADISVNFEGITVPNSVNKEISVIVRWYSDQDHSTSGISKASDYNYYQQIFKALYYVSSASDIANTARTNPELIPANDEYFAVTNYANANTDQLAWTDQTTATANPVTEQVLDKIQFKFGDSDGIFEVAANDKEIFYNDSTDTDNIVITFNSTPVDVLFYNMKTRTIVTSAPTLAANDDVIISLNRVNNPSFFEKYDFAGSDVAIPQIAMTLYSDYVEASLVTLDLPIRTEYVPGTNSFGATYGTDNDWVTGEEIQLDITISLDGITNTLRDRDQVHYMIYDFDNAVTLTKCEYESRSIYRTCSIETPTEIKVVGLDTLDFGASDVINLRVWGRFTHEDEGAEIRVYGKSTDVDAYMKLEVDPTIPNWDNSGTALTPKFLPLHRKYTRDYFELLETKLYVEEGTDFVRDRLEFIMSATQAIGNGHTITLTMEDDQHFLLQSYNASPTTPEEQELECFVFEQISGEKYDFGNGFVVDTCAWTAATDTYTLTFATNGIAMSAGNYLVRIGFKQYIDTTATNIKYVTGGIAMRYAMTIIETAGTTKTDIFAINPIHAFDNALISHSSTTKTGFDFVTVTFDPAFDIDGYDTTDTIDVNIVVELDSKQFENDAGYDAVFTAQNLGDFINGKYIGAQMPSGTIPMPDDSDGNAVADITLNMVTLEKGDKTRNRNFRFVYPRHNDLTNGNDYTLTIPKLNIPDQDFSLHAKIYIEICTTSADYCYIHSMYEFPSHIRSIDDNSQAWVVDIDQNALLQMDNFRWGYSISSYGGSIDTTYTMIFDRNNDDGYDGVTAEEFSTIDLVYYTGVIPVVTHQIDVWYYKILNIHVAQLTDTLNSGTETLYAVDNIETSLYTANYGINRAELQVGGETVRVDADGSEEIIDQMAAKTDPTFERVNGYDNVGSTNLYKLTIPNIPKVPENSHIIVTVDNDDTDEDLHADSRYILGRKCFPSLNFFQSSNRSLSCVKTGDLTFKIRGFQDIGVTEAQHVTDTSIYFYLENKRLQDDIEAQIDIYYEGATDLLIYSYTTTTTTTNNEVKNDIATDAQIFDSIEFFDYHSEIYPYSEKFELLQFSLKSSEEVTDQGQIVITLPSVDIEGNALEWIFQPGADPVIQYVKYKEEDTEDYILADFTYTPATKVLEIDEHANYQFDKTKQYYIILYTSRQNSNQNSVQTPTPSIYRFNADQDEQGAALTETSFYDFYLQPKRDDTFSIDPINHDTSEQTVLKFEYTLQKNFIANDEIWLEFQTNNGLQNVFANDLGWDVKHVMDCVEDTSDDLGFTRDQDSPQIPCYLTEGDRASAKKTTIKLYPQNTQTAGYDFTLFVAPIEIPSNSLESIVIISHRRQCRDDGYMCALSESSDYFNCQNRGGGTTSNTDATLNTVRQENTSHRYFFQMTNGQLNNKDTWFLMKQSYSNHQPAHDYDPHRTCTGNLLCKVFREVSWILTKVEDGFTRSDDQFDLRSVLVSGLKNGYYVGTETWQAILTQPGGQTRMTANYGTLQYNVQTAGSMAVNATQSAQEPNVVDDPNDAIPDQYSPGYTWYVRDFDNIFEININGLWTQDYIHRFSIHRPYYVDYIHRDQSNLHSASKDGRYCNATYVFEGVPKKNYPFPPRFKCEINTNDDIWIYELKGSGIENGAGWALNSDYSIRVYVEGYIKYDYTDYSDAVKNARGASWRIYSYVNNGGYDTQIGHGWRTTTTSRNILTDITPYEQPDLNDLTFNTLSFYDRKARIGDKIEYYMLLKPKTSPLDYIIDTLVFRLPEEFQYPSILTLDQCTMIGKVPETLIPNCKLNRIDRKTYVTSVPEDGDYDDHAIKIMRLSFTTESDLFTAPLLPGDHYNISLAMYSDNILVEKTGINMTDVLGVFFDVSKLQVDPGMDPETKSIYEFDFELGDFDIEAGYEIESTTIWSRIHFIFASKVGYDNDLGTGFAQGDEFGCVVKSGLTTDFTGRLKCEIDLGTNPEDLPTIIVSGYDKAAAGTAVQILVTGIKTLPDWKRVDIKIGVQLIYKYLGGISAFIYEPTAPTLPLATEATYTGVASVEDQIVTVQGDLRVLGYSDYEFTFTTGASIVTTDDYIALQFPEDFFEKYSNFDDVTCEQFDITNSDGDAATDYVPCGARYVFGVSNMIYIQPEQDIAATTQTSIRINGLINPAYSLQETVIITGFVQVGYEEIPDGLGKFRHGVQELTYQFILNREVLPCAQFTSVASLADSYIGGQNDVTFEVEFTTGHPVPTWGAIAITFPPQYDINLVSLGVTCGAKEWDMVNAGGIPTCKAGAANRIDLFLNGYELDQLSRYSIQIFGVTTLNIDSSALEFTIGSYYYDNIYLQRRVCEMQFPFPVLTPIEVKPCELLASSQYSNVNEESIYSFQFQCPEPVREDTMVQLKFPTQYKDTNVIPQTVICKSKETQTLESQICEFKYDNFGDFILEASLQPIEAQKRFTIQVTMNNPAVEKSDYQFSAQFFSKSLLYFEAEQESYQYVTIQRNQDTVVENPDIVDVKLNNIPKNAGEKSTYIFTIPPLSEQVGSTSQFSIQFPNQQENIHQPLAFDADIGENLVCGVYIQDLFDENFFNYHSILELTQQTEGQEQNFEFNGDYIVLPCSVTSTRLLTIFDIDTLSAYSFQNKWFSYIIRNVNNPSSYIDGDQFTLYYLQDSNIQWSYTNELKYFAGEAPGLIKMKEIEITNNNIKNPSEYLFKVYSSETLQYQPKLGISLLLPQLYSDVVSYQEDGMVCTVKLSEEVTLTASCSLYTFEILLWDIQIMGVDTTDLEINIADIINPVLETDCTDLDSAENYYIVKLIDLQSNEIVASTSPSVDDKNCLEFKKKQFNVFISGPSVVQPGLSYEFTINLELEADGLQVEPIATVNGINFEPSVIEFNYFTQKDTTFQLKVRPDTLTGNYWLQFNSAENEGDAFYLPILPFQIQVIDFNEDIQDFPTITVQDFEVDSIGYPINVPVVLSEYLSNSVDFSVDFQNPNDKELITIINQRQTIDTQTLETEFQILINTEVVPKSITLLFSINSFYSVMHRVVPESKTLKFKRNLNSITNKPSLHVLFTQDYIDTDPNELGQDVLNERYESASIDEQEQYVKVKPEIYDKIATNIEANYGEIHALITQKCSLYYSVTYQGSPAPTLDQILNHTYDFALRYGKQNSVTEYERNIDHVGYIKLSQLSGQSNYEIHMVAANAQGYSEIISVAWKTTKLSYGVVIRIPLRTLANQDQMITALSKTLRIPESRLVLMRGQEELEQDKNDYDDLEEIMINPNYYYEVAIAPNAENDVIKPVEYAEYLTQQLYTTQLDNLLPAFDETREVTYRQIRQTSPKMQIEPFVANVGCYTSSISLRLWEQGKIFGIIIETDLVTGTPYSNQIFRGDNERNQPINNYRKFSTLSDENGNATLEFDDLIDNTEYTVFITVGNNLPYEPLMLYDDDKVRVFQFKTPLNLNLNYNFGVIEYVRISHPELANALKKRYAQ